ncbi:MAG: DUF3137 domain-containing protein [Cytophagales bacterium]|nr:DUF3137 domain-containing protein [Cytophagales bacterium]MDW8384359.1 DUF3137 domain-containing protein [Flammeovirgaceae bacterium]
MKTEAEFMEFFQHELLPNVEVLEKRRYGLLNKRLKVVGGGIMFLTVNFLLVQSDTLPKFSFFISLFLVPIVCHYLNIRFLQDTTLDLDFKFQVLSPILAFFDSSLHYAPREYIPYEDFFDSGLLTFRPDKYTGDDLISGTIDGIPIRFSEIRASYRIFHKPKDYCNPCFQDIFWGILLIAEYPVPFEGELLIKTDELQHHLGYIGRLVQENNTIYGSYLYSKETDFSRYFSAYTSDKLSGEKLLTKQIQERLLLIRNRYRAPISLVMRGQTIWVALHTNKEFFSIRKNRKWTDYRYIRTFYEDLTIVLGIINDLNIDELELPISQNQGESKDKFGREKLITKQKVRLLLDKMFDYLVEKVPRLQKEKMKAQEM